MPGNTEVYKLGYFRKGEKTSTRVDVRRFETLDVQLASLFQVLGNGILEGWDLMPSSGLTLAISAGSGHIAFVRTETSEITLLTQLTPNIRNYVYATITSSSYWDKSVEFDAFSSENKLDDNIYLGYVDTNDLTVVNVNMDDRTELGFLSLVETLISEHRHIGGTDNPQPVNLGSEVQGILNQRNLPDMDASILKTGLLDPDRFPEIDHITGLTNQGTLTHAQLDSFTEALVLDGHDLMGETSTINLLQLILALKHIYPGIDDFLVNEIAIIPGITPDSYIDFVNTTATVDTQTWAEGGEHNIIGTPAPARQAYTKTWDTEAEFESGTNNNVIIGDIVVLDTSVTSQVVDIFATVNDWTVTTTDLSAISSTLTQDSTDFVVPPASGKLTIGNKQVEIALTFQKLFDAQDWSEYSYLTFFLKTDNVDHGDLYFFLSDNVAGAQDSYLKVLDRNQPTINIDTLQNGWQQIIIDLTTYTRTQINNLGFYLSTQDGWDTSKGFEFAIDDMLITTGNAYKDNGYMRVRFGSDFFYNFWRVRWDGVIPNIDPDVAGVVLKSRTRVGNSEADLDQSVWSAYSSESSGYDVSVPTGSLYKYIEIEMYFGASTTLTRSIILHKLYLDFYASDIDSSFTYDNQDAWESGSLFNIDTDTVVDSMIIANTDEIDDVFYGTEDSVVQTNDDLSAKYDISGTALPLTTYQSINGLPTGFGTISGVSRGNNGNIWLADIDNDRVVEINKAGQLVSGFYGSALVDIDEDALEPTSPFNIIQVVYNSADGVINIVCDRDVTGYLMDFAKMYFKIGANIFFILNPFVSLLNPLNHVIALSLQQPDITALNKLVLPTPETILILNPSAFSQVGTSPTIDFELYNFKLTGGNKIRVTLDASVTDITEKSISFSGLSEGMHSIKAQLVDSDDILITNTEAIAEGSFVVSDTTIAEPYIYIKTPKINQIYAGSTVSVEFSVTNFPILPTGQHLSYQLDTDATLNYYSEDPIVLEDLDVGKHKMTLVLVNSEGADLGYTYGTATIEFIVGLNTEVPFNIVFLSGTIYQGEDFSNELVAAVPVSNIKFKSIYAPIDVQYVVPSEDGLVEGTIIISKLDSSSNFTSELTADQSITEGTYDDYLSQYRQSSVSTSIKLT